MKYVDISAYRQCKVIFGKQRVTLPILDYCTLPATTGVCLRYSDVVKIVGNPEITTKKVFRGIALAAAACQCQSDDLSIALAKAINAEYDVFLESALLFVSQDTDAIELAQETLLFLERKSAFEYVFAASMLTLAGPRDELRSGVLSRRIDETVTISTLNDDGVVYAVLASIANAGFDSNLASAFLRMFRTVPEKTSRAALTLKDAGFSYESLAWVLYRNLRVACNLGVTKLSDAKTCKVHTLLAGILLSKHEVWSDDEFKTISFLVTKSLNSTCDIVNEDNSTRILSLGNRLNASLFCNLSDDVCVALSNVQLLRRMDPQPLSDMLYRFASEAKCLAYEELPERRELVVLSVYERRFYSDYWDKFSNRFGVQEPEKTKQGVIDEYVQRDLGERDETVSLLENYRLHELGLVGRLQPCELFTMWLTEAQSKFVIKYRKNKMYKVLCEMFSQIGIPAEVGSSTGIATIFSLPKELNRCTNLDVLKEVFWMQEVKHPLYKTAVCCATKGVEKGCVLLKHKALQALYCCDLDESTDYSWILTDNATRILETGGLTDLELYKNLNAEMDEELPPAFWWTDKGTMLLATASKLFSEHRDIVPFYLLEAEYWKDGYGALPELKKLRDSVSMYTLRTDVAIAVRMILTGEYIDPILDDGDLSAAWKQLIPIRFCLSDLVDSMHTVYVFNDNVIKLNDKIYTLTCVNDKMSIVTNEDAQKIPESVQIFAQEHNMQIFVPGGYPCRVECRRSQLGTGLEWLTECSNYLQTCVCLLKGV